MTRAPANTSRASTPTKSIAPKAPDRTALESSWREAMAETLAAHGLDLAQLLSQLGVATEESDARVLSDAYNKVWELAAARSGRLDIGLHTLRHPLVALGPMAHLLLSARHLGEALQLLQRFSVLLSPLVSLELITAPGSSQLRITFLRGLHSVPLQRYDFLAHVLLQSLSWLSGQRICPLAVDYPTAAPADRRPWREALGCEPLFEAQAFSMIFRSGDLLTPIPTANAGVADLCVAQAQQQMASHAGSVGRRVRQALMQQLPKGDPKRDAIATLLCMSERTLQRRLLEESTSFNKLLDETRREQAERFLAKGSISTTEMSFALGFADPSNFYRACKRWFGHSPSHRRCG